VVPTPPGAPVVTQIAAGDDRRSLLVDWDDVADADRFELRWRPAGSTAWNLVAGSGPGTGSAPVTARGPQQQRLDLPTEASGATVDLVVVSCRSDAQPTCGDPATATVATVALTAAPVVDSQRDVGTMTVTWGQPGAAQVLVRPTASVAVLATCATAETTDPAGTAAAVTSLVAGCGDGPVRDELYDVGVRMVQQAAGPRIVGPTAVHRSLPRQCRNTTEVFCAAYPWTFVRTTAADPLMPVAPGTPVTLNGASLKNGPRLDAAGWNDQTAYAITQVGWIGNGPSQWNMIRLALDWPEFQIQNPDGSITVDPAALGELDKILLAARANGLYVVLNPVHLRIPDASFCNTSRFTDAASSIPGWAWAKAGYAPGATPCKDNNANSDARLVALQAAQPELTTFLRTITERYSGDTDLGRTVVAIDLVNEIKAGVGSANATDENQKALAYYGQIVAALRTTIPNKILLAQPAHGDSSLKRNAADLSAFTATSTNLALSVHDYYGGAKAGLTPTDNPTYGYGRSNYGYRDASSMWTNNDVASYVHPDAAAHHRRYAEEYVAWASAARLPVQVGEYGAYSPCEGNSLANVTRYTQDSRDLFSTIHFEPGNPATIELSRTWWSAYDTPMRIISDRAATDSCSPGKGVPFSYAYDT
jgi:hypothetical protein